MLKKFSFLLVSLLTLTSLYAQLNPIDVPILFREDTVPRIDIFIDQDSLDILLDDITSDHEYKVTCVYNNFGENHDTIEDVGFRIRGNVSRMDEKKSFKISINTYAPGRKYMGVEKINLKATGDDSFLRPKLCWHMCQQMGITSLWVNHVMLYINNELYGVYSNVEHVDEEFLKKRFGNNDGNLYKCRYPSDLAWVSNNQDDYKFTEFYFGDREIRVYELKTNTEQDDYTDLMELTDILSNSHDTLFKELFAEKFDVNSLLKFLTLEVYMGHWDSYSYWGNNYYLYNNQYDDKFVYITNDMDLTMGISFGTGDITTRDIYEYEDDYSSRKLRSRVLDVPEYRDNYTFYMKQLLAVCSPDTLRKKAEKIQHFIGPFVEQDPYYWLPMDVFYASLDEPSGMSEYGVIEYVTERYNSILSQLDSVNISPIISDVYYNDHAFDDTVKIRCKVEDDDTIPGVKVFYQFNNNVEIESEMTLISKDTIANAYYFEYIINPLNNPGLLSFYIEATDTTDKLSRSPLRDTYNSVIYKGGADLIISEMLASNRDCMTDEFGEHDDWIEIFNADTIPVNLSNKYLSDSYQNPDDWNLPSITMQPGEYVWFWADNETYQGDNHADFRLSRTGETIYLFEKQGETMVLLDSTAYPELEPDVSYGYLSEDAIVKDHLLQITPGYANETTGIAYITFDVDLNFMIENKSFTVYTDNVDVVGNFNNWEGSQVFSDNNRDGVYTRTLYELAMGDNLEYRFRVNGDDSRQEFPELAGEEGDRTIILEEGCNSVRYFFNDEKWTTIQPLPTLELTIYPNPVIDFVHIQAEHSIASIEVIDLFGNTIDVSQKGSAKEVILDFKDYSKGIYFIKVTSDNNREQIKKVIKN